MIDTLSQCIRQFNRFEFKYIISIKQAEALKASIRKYLVPDTYGNQEGRYAISNLYYDSPDFRCYWEKEYGIRFRRKLRVRYYENGDVMTEETPVFLEIKQRINRVTQKRRVALPYLNALQLCNDRVLPEFDQKHQSIIEEVFVMLWRYQLVPAVVLRYNRQAFIGSIYDAGIRVTFDTDLTFQTNPLHLHENRSSLPFLSADRVIMEIKVNERIPHWLTELVAAHNLSLCRISKYCSSIQAAQNIPGIRYHKPFSESVSETLSSAYSLSQCFGKNSLSQQIKRNKGK